MMMYNPYDENVLIVGSAGSGKSYFVKFIIKKMFLPSSVRFVLWDYNWQYNDIDIKPTHTMRTDNFVIYQPIDKSVEHFSEFCDFYFKGNRVFVIEEVQEYGNAWKMPPIFESVIRTGRNFGNTYIAITQRPSEIHKAIVNNATHIVAFRMTWIKDLELLSEWLNIDYEKIYNLPRFYFIYKNRYEEKPIIYKPIKL